MFCLPFVVSVSFFLFFLLTFVLVIIIARIFPLCNHIFRVRFSARQFGVTGHWYPANGNDSFLPAYFVIK